MIESASCIETQLLINAHMILDKLDSGFINDNLLLKNYCLSQLPFNVNFNLE